MALFLKNKQKCIGRKGTESQHTELAQNKKIKKRSILPSFQLIKVIFKDDF